MTDSTLFFWRTQILSNSLFKWGLWIYFINFRNRLCFIKKTLLRQCEPIAQAFVLTFALVCYYSPRVSLRANVPLWAPISCLGPASATPRFNRALGSEIWAWQAGCTRAPFIWFQSSLRPRMWLRGHSFFRHWGGGVGDVFVWRSVKECVCMCAAFIWSSSSGMDKGIHSNHLELRHAQASWQAFNKFKCLLLYFSF